MVGGFIFPTEGEIYINGEAMGNRPPNRRNTSMVFQNYALFPHMKVFENIAFGLRERKLSEEIIRQKVQTILGVVGLRGLEHRRATELSGGQQQRVALARSLVIEPTVLLLDEPLGALDLKMRKQMQEELKNLQSRLGITFIYVTHDQEEALVMSNKIAVMNHGRIEQMGSVKDVYERPKTRFVAEFIGEANIFQGKVLHTDEREAILDLMGHSVKVDNEKGLKQGESVEFFVRPEKILLGEAARKTGNSLRAEIVEIIYKGSMINLVLKVADQITLRVQEQMTGQNTPYSVFDQIDVGWSADCALPIKEEGISLY
jgi:ABC-type Fe3+/spermidine/putrescine transport system ATPase subunit